MLDRSFDWYTISLSDAEMYLKIVNGIIGEDPVDFSEIEHPKREQFLNELISFRDFIVVTVNSKSKSTKIPMLHQRIYNSMLCVGLLTPVSKMN